MQEHNGKARLIVLKLIHYLQREHDAVWYVGYYNQVIEYINDIKACNTYQVKTKGMLESDYHDYHKLKLWEFDCFWNVVSR